MPDDDPLAGRLKKYLTDGAETGRTRTDRPNDLHTTRAAKVWGIDEKEVTPQQRQAVKNASFGWNYGMRFDMNLKPMEPKPWTEQDEESLIRVLRRLFDVPDKPSDGSSSSST